MATTTNLGLPLIGDNTSNDVKRDLNALAEAIDAAVGNISIPDASLTEKGKVQLSNETNGTREDVAPTEKALGLVMKEAQAGKQAGIDRKAEVVAALNSIGVSASTSETWVQLIPKIAAVIRATGNATAEDLLAGKTASNVSGPITGSIPNNSRAVLGQGYKNGVSAKGDGGGNLVVEPSTGYYESGKNAAGFGSILVNDPNFKASNILSTATIFGVGGVAQPNTYARSTINYNKSGFTIPYDGQGVYESFFRIPSNFQIATWRNTGNSNMLSNGSYGVLELQLRSGNGATAQNILIVYAGGGITYLQSIHIDRELREVVINYTNSYSADTNYRKVISIISGTDMASLELGILFYAHASGAAGPFTAVVSGTMKTF